MKFAPEPILAEEVWSYREDTGAGMMEAKRHLRLKAFNEAFNPWRSKATLEDKVEFILDWISDRENC